MERGADVNAFDKEMSPPLFLAARKNRLSVALKLIAKGARMEDVDKCGHTPLMEAIGEGHKDMVRLLLGKGKYATCPLVGLVFSYSI